MYKTCPHWNELIVINYFHNNLSTEEKFHFQAHLEKCSQCQERFQLTWEIILDDSTDEEDEDIARILNSPAWKK
ncbi:MAG: hypothetical protein AB1489_15565, partial [Acidobacteriota bacterium]